MKKILVLLLMIVGMNAFAKDLFQLKIKADNKWTTETITEQSYMELKNHYFKSEYESTQPTVFHKQTDKGVVDVTAGRSIHTELNTESFGAQRAKLVWYFIDEN